ncbi:MAG TPA: NUDIX domain-containing protein, partial [Longimicrobium sp.]|nr:NUDIX domain-containing protein [Longimicrobium sp.]
RRRISASGPPSASRRRTTVAAGGFTAVQARQAATVLLVRDGPAEPEVLLLRRHGRSGFAADAWVFPGGVVDATDRDLSVVDRLDGPTPAEWAERLGMEDADEAMGYVNAAIREAFEETGILLARPDPEGPTQIDDAEGMAVARRALLNDVVKLSDVAVGNGLRLAGDAMIYIAHWITPEPEPRRFDTRFFAARAPDDAVCDVHDLEMTDSVWLPPAEAVERFRDGQMKLLPPTVRTLEQLSGFATFDALRASLADAEVPAILPRMRRDPDGVAIVVPD